MQVLNLNCPEAVGKDIHEMGVLEKTNSRVRIVERKKYFGLPIPDLGSLLCQVRGRSLNNPTVTCRSWHFQDGCHQ